jgi:hypothetical protein
MEKYSFDSPKVTRDEATELCVYHLRMAAALFQVVPDDQNVALNNEIDRQFKDGVDSVELLPAKTWADEMWAAYNAMKEDD